MAENESGIPVKLTDSKSGIPVKVVNAEDFSTGDVELTNYYTKTETDNLIGNLSAEDISYSNADYPDVTNLKIANDEEAKAIKRKVNLDENSFINLIDVGNVRQMEVFYTDEVTNLIESFPLMTKGTGGVDGSALIRHGANSSLTLARNVPHQIAMESTLAINGNGTCFSKELSKLVVDDDSRNRFIKYYISVFSNLEFTYRVFVKDEDGNELGEQTFTTTANDNTSFNYSFDYVSNNDIDKYTLWIEELDGSYQGGYITINGTTDLGATVYNDGNFIIDSKFLPQEEYIPFTSIANLTLNETKQTLLSVAPLNKGIMQIKPNDLTANLILNRSGGGTSVGYVNVSIYLNGIEANTVSASFDSNRDGILLPISNALKVDNYDTMQMLEVKVSYTSTPNGANIGAGTLEITGGVGSLTATPK